VLGKFARALIYEQLDALVRVLDALDLVSDARDVYALLLHIVHKLLWGKTHLASKLELAGGIINGPAKTRGLLSKGAA